MSAAVKLGAAVALGLALGVAAGARVRAEAAYARADVDPVPFAARALAVPRATIDVDGELDDPGWPSAAFAGALADERGGRARPYTDVRVARDDRYVYLTIYCADEDLRATDAVHVGLGAASFDAHPTGALDGAPPGTKVGADVDGTLNDPKDDDEEWVLEVAVPRAAIGPDPTPSLTARRCDALKDGTVRCASLERGLDLR